MKNLTVKSIGNAKVIVDIVRKGNKEIRPATPMNPEEIAVHNTGNSGRGADAEAHNKYIHNMSKLPESATGYASWHFSVDDKFIYQHLPLDERAWHTGDGSGAKSGNRLAIGIEICENPETNIKQAEENAIALIVYLMKELNINVQKVKPHQEYSGKFCPRVILKRDGSFTPFRNRVALASKPKPAKPVSSPPVTSVLVRKGEVISNVWTQKQPAFSEKGRVKVVEAGDVYKVYREETGYYYLGGNEWINKKYMKLLPLKGVVTSDVWTQRNPFFLNTGRVKVVEQGAEYKVYSEKNGYYNLGGDEWINKNYMNLI